MTSLKTISVPRLELSAASLLFVRCISCAQRSNSRISSITAGLHYYIRLAESVIFPMENFRRQSYFGCTISFLKFLGVMFRRTSIPRIARIHGFAPDLFETHALWWSSPPWIHLLEYWLNSCPLVSPDISLEQCSESLALHATPTWDLVSRYSSWPKSLRTIAYLTFSQLTPTF